jgi:carbonic anhydrase/acetyltransferase-like protein (isoleucine patch superfamily)
MALYELDGVGVETPGEGRYWVAPNAVLVGKVFLEEDVSVWFGSVIRGDNEPIRIGARSNVQEACVLHTDPGFPLMIGADCTIGHMVMLHGCTIGRGSIVGIGSIILNGAKIGEECLIGQYADRRGQETRRARWCWALRQDRAPAHRRGRDEASGAAGRYVKNWNASLPGSKAQAN